MSQYQYVKDVEVRLFNHEIYRTKEDVMRQIKENQKEIERLKQQLFGMVCGRLCDMYQHEENDSYTLVERAQQDFATIFDEELYGIEFLIAHNVDLWYIHDNFERTEVG